MNKNFVALFTTFEMQKDDNIIIVLGCIRVFKNKVIFKKVVSKGWCKESRHAIDGASPSVFRCTSTPMETCPIGTCVET